MLFALLGRHADLRPEALDIARAMLTAVDVEDVAIAVADAVLGTDPDDINGRAGPTSCATSLTQHTSTLSESRAGLRWRWGSRGSGADRRDQGTAGFA